MSLYSNISGKLDKQEKPYGNISVDSRQTTYYLEVYTFTWPIPTLQKG